MYQIKIDEDVFFVYISFEYKIGHEVLLFILPSSKSTLEL